jgi:hypothetical protein
MAAATSRRAPRAVSRESLERSTSAASAAATSAVLALAASATAAYLIADSARRSRVRPWRRGTK